MNRKLITLLLIGWLPGAVMAQEMTSEKQSVSLQQCIEGAMSTSTALLNARLDRDAARCDREIAFTKYFPQVSLSGLSFMAVNPLIRYGISDLDNAALRQSLYTQWFENGRAKGIPNKIEELDKGTYIGLTALQPIFMGGQIASGNALAKVGVEAAALKEEIVRKDLVLEVEESYFLVNSLQTKRATVVSALALLDTVDRSVSAALRAGVATSSDALKVKIRRKEMQANLESIDEGIALAMQALCRISGIDYSSELVLADTLLLSPSSPYDLYVIENQAVESRPETQLLNLNVRAQTLQKRMAVGAALPSIALGGGLSYNNFLDRNNWNGLAFVTIKVPLTAWWENSYRIRKSNIAIAQAQNTLSDTEKLLSLQTTKVWNELLKAWRDLEVLDGLMEDVRTNCRNVLVNYRAGYATTAELLEAQLLLQQTESDRCDALITYALKKREYLNCTSPLQGDPHVALCAPQDDTGNVIASPSLPRHCKEILTSHSVLLRMTQGTSLRAPLFHVIARSTKCDVAI